MVEIFIFRTNFLTRKIFHWFIKCVFVQNLVLNLAVMSDVWLQLLVEFIVYLLHMSVLVKKQFVGKDCFVLLCF